jgi:hypothetical protein
MGPGPVFPKLSKLLNQRARTERTLLKHFRNQAGGAKAARCEFPREITKKACRFGPHPLPNCLNAVIPALRRRALADAGMLRTDLTVTFCRVMVSFTGPSGWRALMLPGGGRRMQGRTYRCKAKQSRHRKTAPTCVTTSHGSTVLGWRREPEKNSLVTAIERLLVKWLAPPQRRSS